MCDCALTIDQPPVYNAEFDNYYCPKCNAGMGVAYYRIARKYDALVTTLAEQNATINTYKADLVEASGELMVAIPQPGTKTAQLMLANRIMRRQRDLARSKALAFIKLEELFGEGLAGDGLNLWKDSAGHCHLTNDRHTIKSTGETLADAVNNAKNPNEH